MAWYRTGTVTLTNGSPIVTGTGTAFVANIQPGHAINLPDGRAYEVLSVQSDTQLTLGNPNGYLGATANGQAYSVQPNQGFAQTAATRLADFLSQFGGYVSTVLAGLFPDGTLGRPGVAFANDQDTGARRIGDNAFALVSGGRDALSVNADLSVTIGGNVGVGTNLPAARLHAVLSTTAPNACQLLFGYQGSNNYYDGNSHIFRDGSFNETLRLQSGNLLVGVPNGSNHRIVKPGVSGGGKIFEVDNGAFPCLELYAGNAAYGSSALCVARLSTVAATGRSLNVGGTVNASGADYAEYMTKADGCGPIAKGDVCGVDRDGKLTRAWAHALSFMVKSTDPNLVGGDAWSQHLGPRPEDPGDAPIAPVMPTAPGFGGAAVPVQEPDEEIGAFAARLADYMVAFRDAQAENDAYQVALTAFQERSAAYPGELAEFTARREAYDRDLPVWEAELEAARATVDRIAYCGQTPVNVTDEALAACEAALADGDAVYLVAVTNGGGIGVKAVREADMTIGDYMRRIGKVLRIEADRPIVDVQHG